MTDWLNKHKLGELIVEGGKMYVFHPAGCDKAPSLTIRELLDLSNRMARVLRELVAFIHALNDGTIQTLEEEIDIHRVTGGDFSDDAEALSVASNDES